MTLWPLFLAVSFGDPAAAPVQPPQTTAPAAYDEAAPEAAADATEEDDEPRGIAVESVLLTLIEEREIPAREAGILARLDYREGDLVKPDAELGRIDDRDAVLAERRAEIDLDIARAKVDDETAIHIAEKSLELAEDELRRTERVRELVIRGKVDADLQRDRLRRDVAKLELEKAERELSRNGLSARLKEKELEIAQQAVARRRILSPIGGMVVQVHRRPGEWVEPSEPVLRLLRIDKLRAEAFLDAHVATMDLLGRRVTVVANLPNRTGARFEGKVAFVSPEINPVDNMVRVWIDVANPDLELRPGQEVDLTIEPAATAAASTASRPAERE